MASLSKENKKGYRIQWRFVVRVGPRAGETVAGSLLLGRCTKAAAKAQLRDIETWEEAVKTGRHLPDTSWKEVTGAWLDDWQYNAESLHRPCWGPGESIVSHVSPAPGFGRRPTCSGTWRRPDRCASACQWAEATVDSSP